MARKVSFRHGSFSETRLPLNPLLGNWISASDHPRKPKSGLLGARVESKPNTRANNRVIDEARFELADAPLKRRIQPTTPDTGW